MSWDGAWTTPGGDFDRSEHAVWIAQPGEDSLLRFDLTDMVSGWASGDLMNSGVLVAVSPGAAGSIGEVDAQGGGAEAPVLQVWYAPQRDGGR